MNSAVNTDTFDNTDILSPQGSRMKATIASLVMPTREQSEPGGLLSSDAVANTSP